MKITHIFKIVTIPVVAASLCCLSPLVLVLLGLSTASFAASLADTFYGTYKWAFRGLGVLLLFMSVWYYWAKSRGVCTLDAAKAHRNEIINSLLLTGTIGILGYLFFLYIVVHYAGVWLDIWV